MNETDDIVARLRATSALTLEAATEIKRLRIRSTQRDGRIETLEERCAALTGQVEAGAAKIERLTKEATPPGIITRSVEMHHRAKAAERETAALKEEVGRLRGALEPFASIEIDGLTEIVPNGYDPQPWREHVRNARAALQPQEPKP